MGRIMAQRCRGTRSAAVDKEKAPGPTQRRGLPVTLPAGLGTGGSWGRPVGLRGMWGIG
jgi:hypothetical protein